MTPCQFGDRFVTVEAPSCTSPAAAVRFDRDRWWDLCEEHNRFLSEVQQLAIKWHNDPLLRTLVLGHAPTD